MYSLMYSLFRIFVCGMMLVLLVPILLPSPLFQEEEGRFRYGSFQLSAYPLLEWGSLVIEADGVRLVVMTR